MPKNAGPGQESRKKGEGAGWRLWDESAQTIPAIPALPVSPRPPVPLHPCPFCALSVPRPHAGHGATTLSPSTSCCPDALLISRHRVYIPRHCGPEVSLTLIDSRNSQSCNHERLGTSPRPAWCGSAASAAQRHATSSPSCSCCSRCSLPASPRPLRRRFISPDTPPPALPLAPSRTTRRWSRPRSSPST